MSFDWIHQPDAWIALLTLTILEIVLGIDNIIFLSIVTNKLPAARQPLARRIGLGLAMLMRIGLLLSITWIMRLTTPLFGLFGHEFSGRDLVLLFGGLFLLGKSTFEIHDKLEGKGHGGAVAKTVSFTSAIVQVVLLDLVFSLDSVITAVGMADHVPVMVLAVVIAVAVMMLSATAVSNFVDRHPTVTILALAFLILIGMSLVADGFGQHIPKGYIYFAMGFSVFVEMLNLRMRKSRPVKLHGPRVDDPEATP